MNIFGKLNNSMDDQDEVKINPLTLSFSSDIMNESFSIYQATKALRVFRLSILLAIVIYIVFGFIQSIILSNPADSITIIRVFGIVFFISFYFLSFTSYFTQNYQKFVTLFIIGGGINVILITIAGENFLYVGLILALIYAHSLLRMKFINATLSTWLLVVTYLIISLSSDVLTASQNINSAFFLSSANILGMFASYGIEFYMRSEFLKTHLLKQKSKELESEYRRKSDELEAARQIQLSMIPQVLPEHPNLDITVCMCTASEIGGDYYDFHLSEDNTLTFTIGDATGHGAQAGAMVTAIKTLFSNYAPYMEITEFLKKANHFIKQIKLPKLFMSLAVGKIRSDILEVSGIGLPPLLIFRAKDGLVEEIPLKGMPLGSFMNFPFIKRKIRLFPNDILVFMTDGLPELFNVDQEMFGTQKIKDIVASNSSASAQEILQKINNQALLWNSNHQQDDMTIMIMKSKVRSYMRNESITRKPAMELLKTS